MSNKNFDQGRSVGEREGSPAYSDAYEPYRVSGDMDKYMGLNALGFPSDTADSGRNQPIRGRVDRAPIPGTHGSQVINGTGVHTNPSNREIQNLVLEQMAQNCSTAQYDHSHTITVQRGNSKQDFTDGTGRGKIPATLQFGGLGNAYGRPGPSGHDPVDTDAPTDYIANPGGLDRYVGAKSVLADSEYGSGFPRDHERSQFETMGESILNGLLGQQRKGK